MSTVEAIRVAPDLDQSTRAELTWNERWNGPDRGLNASWDAGRHLAKEMPALAKRARDGELVMLPWKGGVQRRTKAGHKYGTLKYLAMWQGLRGDSLQVALDREVTLKCSRTAMEVTYTPEPKKFLGRGRPY
jgi:hypothetical protein